MKKTSIVITILFFSLVVNAQKKVNIGMLGGISSSNFYNQDVNYKTENLISYSLGGDIGYLINDNFSIRANLLYEEKGGVINMPLNFGNGVNIDPAIAIQQYTTNLKLNYLTFNLLARGSFGKKIKFIAEGGPYVGYLLTAKM